MNFKTRSLLAIAFGTVLSLSVLSIASIPQATADDDERSKDHFSKRPDFVSENCIVTSFATNNLSPEALDSLDCKMQAWLDNKGKSLKYKIEIAGMELINSNASTQDDVDGAHIHKMTAGIVENPKGPHQLNVFAHPGFDDSDVVIKPVQGIIKGIWDDGDENLSYGEPDNSHTLTENLQLLCEGKVFSAVHGDAEDTPGHKAPYLKMLLEPTKDGEKVCKKLGF
jgi:hypothetical protein